VELKLELMLGGRASLLGRKRLPLPLWRSGDSSEKMAEGERFATIYELR